MDNNLLIRGKERERARECERELCYINGRKCERKIVCSDKIISLYMPYVYTIKNII